MVSSDGEAKIKPDRDHQQRDVVASTPQRFGREVEQSSKRGESEEIREPFERAGSRRAEGVRGETSVRNFVGCAGCNRGEFGNGLGRE